MKKYLIVFDNYIYHKFLVNCTEESFMIFVDEIHKYYNVKYKRYGFNIKTKIKVCDEQSLLELFKKENKGQNFFENRNIIRFPKCIQNLLLSGDKNKIKLAINIIKNGKEEK